MSYGNQLNIFRAKADKYGPDWKAMVLCENEHQRRLAHEDALQFTGGRFFNGFNLLKLANGAAMQFRIVNSVEEAERAFKGKEFTQIVWLRWPADVKVRDLARARLRSQTVPADDWRYEYVTVAYGS